MNIAQQNSNSSPNFFCSKCNSLISSQEIKSNFFFLDKNFISLINSLSSKIKSFHRKIITILYDIKNITNSLESQATHSKSLAKLLLIKNSSFIERYGQLCDRIDIIIEGKKILDDNLVLFNDNLKIFINDANLVFKKMQIQYNKQKENQSKKLNYFSDNYESENDDNHYINNVNRNLDLQKSIKFNDIKVNKSNEIIRETLKLNSSPIYRNIQNLRNVVNNIQLTDYHQKNKNSTNNTLIFPNNINQNIFNCTITSNDLQNLNKRKNINFSNVNKFKNKSQSIDESKKEINKIVRSSSIPDMMKKNKGINYNIINNNNSKKINNNSSKALYNIGALIQNKVLILYNKIKELFEHFNKNNFQEKNILIEKIDEIEEIINNILGKYSNIKDSKSNQKVDKKINNNNNIDINELENKNDLRGKNSTELLNNFKILTEKISDLEDKLKEKDEYIKYLKKYNINKNEDNKISEINIKNEELEKENNNLKNELNKLNELKDENESLNQMINNLKKEMDNLTQKEKELNNLNEKNIHLIEELNNKEKKINKLDESIKLLEEEKKAKNEEYKNNISEKNTIIQEMKNQIENYKKEISNLNNNIKNNNKESELVMEIVNLKKINTNLNKKINELRKKSNNNINSGEKEFIPPSDDEVIKLKDDLYKITQENKILIEQNNEFKAKQKYLDIEINKKEELIQSMKNKIDINEKELKKLQTCYQNSSESLSISKNSIGFDIINLDAPDINNLNIEDFRKQNEKLIKLKEMFNKYKNDKQIEISIYKNEYEELKKEMKELKSDINGNNIKIYSSEKYNILCDKNYKNLTWYLLIPKNIIFSNTYENIIWVPRNKILNIEKFNKFESENDYQNTLISNYLTKLERKEEIISKLKYKISCFEKNIYTSLSDELNPKEDMSTIGIEKMNRILNQLIEAEKKIKMLEEENIKLKEKIDKKVKIKNKALKEKYTDDSNKLGYDKKYSLDIKKDEEKIDEKENSNISDKDAHNEEDELEDEEEEESDGLNNDLIEELENTKIELDKITNEYNFLANKFNILRENFCNLLIKMKISKKYKNDIIQILKLLEFSENEILFIVDRKKLY